MICKLLCFIIKILNSTLLSDNTLLDQLAAENEKTTVYQPKTSFDDSQCLTSKQLRGKKEKTGRVKTVKRPLDTLKPMCHDNGDRTVILVDKAMYACGDGALHELFMNHLKRKDTRWTSSADQTYWAHCAHQVSDAMLGVQALSSKKLE